MNKAINRIEINLRTQLVYIVSNEYSQYPIWFANKKVMHGKFVDEFPNFYNSKFENNNKPIKKHRIKYPNDIYAPAWKTLEFFTFGGIYSVFYSLKDNDLKFKIAMNYGFKSVKTFQSFFQTTLFIRNICAHSGILYDSNTPKEISTTRFFEFNNNNKHSLDSAIKVILHLLSKISNGRKIEIENEINKLFDKFQSNEVINKIITEKIGHVKKLY